MSELDLEAIDSDPDELKFARKDIRALVTEVRRLRAIAGTELDVALKAENATLKADIIAKHDAYTALNDENAALRAKVKELRGLFREVMRLEHHICEDDECGKNPVPCVFGRVEAALRENAK